MIQQSVLPLTASIISSATYTGDNGLELDAVPLGQAGRVCGMAERPCNRCMVRLGGEGEGGGVRLIRRVGSVGAVSYSTNPLPLSPQIVFV